MTSEFDSFDTRRHQLEDEHQALLSRPNEPLKPGNGIFARWKNSVLSGEHAPLHWRYDFDRVRNPFLMERLGINAAFNAGAIKLDDEYHLVARVEGKDRKSFFAVASSPTGVDNFRFRDLPIAMPETEQRDTNVYDMRVVRHEDGWIYGLFCVERPDPDQPGDNSACIAQCGIARSRDLDTWERLPDLQTPSPQQRNVVLHPEFVDGRYALYTRPQADFIGAAGEGFGWGLTETMEAAVVTEETVIDPCRYHTVKELKNGQGPAPLRTKAGWLHLAHGVRNTAAGFRYVLYLLLSDLDEPWRITHRPGGYLISPEGAERVGDVSNVVFSNGWILDDDGRVFIYYASSDTRLHVATSTVGRLLDYAMNTPPDPYFTADCVEQRRELARRTIEAGPGS
jgi:4-O-beta-D-mannosyl-D-glucose phosphorylase